jgi:hypothetical protein
MKKGLRRIAWVFASLLGVGLLGAVVVTVVVERESRYVSESLGGEGPRRALILYHPSRDAHFSEEISAAVAEGLKSAGLQVDRATLTHETPTDPVGYDVIAVVSNTFWSTPDLPTLRYLKRAKWDGVPVVGLICGSGSTDRSERILAERLRLTARTCLGRAHTGSCDRTMRAGCRSLTGRSPVIWRGSSEARRHGPLSPVTERS